MELIRPFGSNKLIKEEDINHNYVSCFWIKKFFNDEEMMRIRLLWDDALTLDGRIIEDSKPALDYEKRKSKIMYLEETGNEWIYDKLAMACVLANNNRFKFNIDGFQTKLQLSKYSSDNFIDWHADFGPGIQSIRKLSISVQLSDPSEYEGGELQFIGDLNAPKEKGTAIIFPSFAIHRVTPVTSGCRMSIVGWIGGLPYR